MMISEFNETLDKECNEMDYEVVEAVYMWHPAFDREDGKRVAIELYRLMGVRPFLEMHPTAMKGKDLHDKCESLRAQLRAAEADMRNFKADNR